MKWEDYKKYIISTGTIVRCDVTPLFENPKMFHSLVRDLTKGFNKKDFDKVIALDALGFVLGSAIAYKFKKPLVLVRKTGKLPYKKNKLVRREFIDYTKKKKGFEMKKDSIKRGDKILIVDEWIDTGTQIENAIKLVEKLGGKIIGIASISVKENDLIKKLSEKYPIKAIRVKK